MIQVIIEIEAKTATVRLAGTKAPPPRQADLPGFAKQMLTTVLGTPAPWELTERKDEALSTTMFFHIPIPEMAKG